MSALLPHGATLDALVGGLLGRERDDALDEDTGHVHILRVDLAGLDELLPQAAAATAIASTPRVTSQGRTSRRKSSAKTIALVTTNPGTSTKGPKTRLMHASAPTVAT